MSGSNDQQTLEQIQEAIEMLPMQGPGDIQYVPPHVRRIVPTDERGSEAGGAEAGPSTAPGPSTSAGPSPAVPRRAYIPPVGPNVPPPPAPNFLNRRVVDPHVERPRFSFVEPFRQVVTTANWTRANMISAAVNTATSVTTGLLSHFNQPVVTWVWAPLVVFAANDPVQRMDFEAIPNKFLHSYYESTGLDSYMMFSFAHGQHTRTYFSAQLVYDAGIASVATSSVGTGHSPNPLVAKVGGYGFNTLAHFAAVTTPVIQLSRMISLYNRGWSHNDDFSEWFRWIVGLKGSRVAYRGFLVSLPAWEPSFILAALASYGGISMARQWMVGDYIENMAQYMHFKLWDEQGWLSRANDCIITRENDAVTGIAFARGIETRLPDFRADQGAASRSVEALFRDDLRGHWPGSAFVGDMMKEPCGWMTIAHKIAQL